MRKTIMKASNVVLACAASALLLAQCAISSADNASVALDAGDVHLAPNQTLGFGANELLRFTYTENFDCVDQPTDDRNYNGTPAESDPTELEQDICQDGIPSTIDPTGAPVAQTDKLYVLVPMFSLNDDQNPDDAFTPALGRTLISLFGAVPEAFKTNPLVPVQCPNPGSPPGSCTMHGDKIDLFPLLAALGKVPATPKQNIFVPLPDHDHLVKRSAINTPPEWWQIITVLVTEPSYWPTVNGASGITSFAKLKQAESDGVAIQTPTNYFLFFSSKPIGRLH
jgi:hypothetical protein